jgi:hypothetical protein
MSIHAFDIVFTVDQENEKATGLDRNAIAQMMVGQFRRPESGRHAGRLDMWGMVRLAANHWEDAEQLDDDGKDQTSWTFDLITKAGETLEIKLTEYTS